MTVVLVHKRSAWEQYLANPEPLGAPSADSLNRMRSSHERHQATLDNVMAALESLKVSPWVVSGADTQFKALPGDRVVTVGGDGTFLSASHNIGSDVPIMGINSDPMYSLGRFCSLPAAIHVMARNFQCLLEDNPRKITVPRLAVHVDRNLVASRILNEALFSHSCPAAMTRLVTQNTRVSCSGIWVGTAAGSTGALWSAGGNPQTLTDEGLQMIVREPFYDRINGSPPFRGQTRFMESSFVVVSKIPEGTLYFDGPFLRVPVGMDQEMIFSNSEEPLTVIGPSPV